MSIHYICSLFSQIRFPGAIEDNIIAFHVPVEFSKLLLEVKIASLVFVFSREVRLTTHFAVITTVILEHIS